MHRPSFLSAKVVRKKWWLAIPVVLFASGIYLLITILAPAVMPPATVDFTSQSAQPQDITEDRLYIPKIGVDVLITTGGSEALEKGAWHRKPENGDPEKGGNFVLSAHRFQMGWTPGQTQEKSPFYHIDKLQAGDRLYVDYDQKRYTYEVTNKYAVSRYATQIEAPSDESKLTLYSCTLEGEAAGRDVIEARPVAVENNAS